MDLHLNKLESAYDGGFGDRHLQALHALELHFLVCSAAWTGDEEDEQDEEHEDVAVHLWPEPNVELNLGKMPDVLRVGAFMRAAKKKSV